ncbi:MAG: hypothetical protein CO080_03705 [Nitrospirae bacterium CG_4_9_14_0_8_um_filter_70_14]|nr:MAG: hypothetical protein CO080_03705 [Nitrospirae bacterium CG_4_9_14_0_8_um_filter_70_14]
MSTPTLDTLIAGSCDIPSAPPVVTDLMAAMANPMTDAQQIAAVIARDPTLVAQLLRVANSPFYGRRGQVASVEAAVMTLGFHAVRNLVVALSTRGVYGEFTGLTRTLWDHANAVAQASGAIAKHVGKISVEDALAAGLLHDLGMVLLLRADPPGYEALVAGAGDVIALAAAERARFGFDHGDAGAAVVLHWSLPESLVAVVGAVHCLTRVAEEGAPVTRLAACVTLADGLCGERGLAPVGPPPGWDGGGALELLNHGVALDELRAVVEESLSQAQGIPM